jgi:hypothetical protein
MTRAELDTDRKAYRCSACDVYRRLTPDGNIRLHRKDRDGGAPCPGSLLPPRPLPDKKPPSWSSIRKAVLARDGGRCQKCGSPHGLEAHHIHAKADGGADEPGNLVTLCGSCHDEWHYAEPPAEMMSFEQWLTIPAARYLVAVWTRPWPDNKTAAQFKSEIAAMFKLLEAQR